MIFTRVFAFFAAAVLAGSANAAALIASDPGS
jgi:hypothetical protein